MFKGFFFASDIEIEPPPTHGQEIFLDGGGTCDSLLPMVGGHMPPSTEQPFQGSAVSTSISLFSGNGWVGKRIEP